MNTPPDTCDTCRHFDAAEQTAPVVKTRAPVLTRRRLTTIRSSPENQQLYRPVRRDDPEVQALAKSIADFGLKEPILITLDNYIISGHRRQVAAKLAGMKMVPVRIEPIRRDGGDRDRFVQLLAECNRQRIKTRAEKAREVAVAADPHEAYQSLIEHRKNLARVDVPQIKLRTAKRRDGISSAKLPFLKAVIAVIENRRDFWPLSVRGIHYCLLNDPPLRHAKKPGSIYQNDRPSYQDLDDLTVRARLTGDIAWDAIADETRPVVTWNVHCDVNTFISDQLDHFLKGYWRDLLQSQPNHIEIIGEKLTVQGIIRPAAMKYCVPYSIGRGYGSLPIRAEMVQRWEASGKDKLILLILSDFDPDGEEIAHSFARSLRDDFDVDEKLLVPIKVALTSDQVVEFKLPSKMTAKKDSAGYERFTKQHGKNAYELEALQPEQLQAVLQRAIDNVLDTEAFNAEIDQEHEDAAFLEETRWQVLEAIRDEL